MNRWLTLDAIEDHSQMEVRVMRLTWRDAVATVMVGALVLMYIGLLANGSVGFIQGPRSMASIGLLSALVLCPLSGIKVFDAWAGAIGILGVGTLGVGIAVLVAESWVMLAAFMLAVVAMWALSTLHHAVGDVHGAVAHHGATPA
jgi:hypothetical protein